MSVSHKRGKRQARDDRVVLRRADFQPSLVGKQLQVFWPADKKWWTVTILDIHVAAHKATLLYETSRCTAAQLC